MIAQQGGLTTRLTPAPDFIDFVNQCRSSAWENARFLQAQVDRTCEMLSTRVKFNCDNELRQELGRIWQKTVSTSGVHQRSPTDASPFATLPRGATQLSLWVRLASPRNVSFPTAWSIQSAAWLVKSSW